MQEQRDAAEKIFKGLICEPRRKTNRPRCQHSQKSNSSGEREALKKDKADLQFRIDREKEDLLEIDKALEVSRAKANELSAKKKSWDYCEIFPQKRLLRVEKKLTALNGSASQIEIDYVGRNSTSGK